MYFVFRVFFNAVTGKESHSTEYFTTLVQAQKRFYTILASDIDKDEYSYEIVMIVDRNGLTLAAQVLENETQPVEE